MFVNSNRKCEHPTFGLNPKVHFSPWWWHCTCFWPVRQMIEKCRGGFCGNAHISIPLSCGIPVSAHLSRPKNSAHPVSGISPPPPTHPQQLLHKFTILSHHVVMLWKMLWSWSRGGWNNLRPASGAEIVVDYADTCWNSLWLPSTKSV